MLSFKLNNVKNGNTIAKQVSFILKFPKKYKKLKLFYFISIEFTVTF